MLKSSIHNLVKCGQKSGSPRVSYIIALSDWRSNDAYNVRVARGKDNDQQHNVISQDI